MIGPILVVPICVAAAPARPQHIHITPLSPPPPPHAHAGRIQYAKGASLSGWVLVDGQPRNDGEFKRMSAYVMQDDVLYAFLTVKETIWLSAQLHLPPAVSYEEKERYALSFLFVPHPS